MSLVPFDAPLMPGAQPQHGEECEHEGDGDRTPTSGPPPLTRSMMRGMRSHPQRATMIAAEATNGA